MNAKLFFASLLAIVFLSSCSGNEPVIIPGNDDTVGEPRFLTVNLLTTGESASVSRAAGDQTPGDPDGNKIYEEGLDAENKVTAVRFYFFNGDEAANVRGDSKLNYIEYTPEFTGKNDVPNVEKILSATLVLQTDKGAAMPQTMVAVVNPTSDLPDGAITLTALKEIFADYAKDYTADGKFVMSNSTYVKGNGESAVEMMVVDVADNIMNSKADALDNPVDIYVERTVAKVRVGCASTLKAAITLNKGTDKEILLYDPSKRDDDGNIIKDEEQKFDDTKIYVKFLGWNVTAAAGSSRLIKKINKSWSSTLLGPVFGPWNWEAYCRSFWACNVSGLDYHYGAFRTNSDADNLFQAQARKFGKTKDWTYLNENACDEPDDATKGDVVNTPSKVIIAAQLVDEKDNAVEFAEYGSSRYSLAALTKLFANSCDLYRRTVGADNKVKFSKITPDDLRIVTATAAGLADEGRPGRYKAYVQLTEAAENEKWYPSNDENQTESNALTKENANKALVGLGSAKVWKEGYTYYYFDIEHGALNGVVRNHIYDADITKLAGLGTPVYNPDEIIYPEKPTPETDTYLTARIYILSWRVVRNDVTLEW